MTDVLIEVHIKKILCPEKILRFPLPPPPNNLAEKILISNGNVVGKSDTTPPPPPPLFKLFATALYIVVH